MYIKYLLLIILGLYRLSLYSQPIGYYNGTEGKSGEELKSALHQIIDSHVDFSYYFAKNIINYTDADPENSDNVILFYLQESRDASLYGIDGDYINREHVWAKSHGYFKDMRPMDSDGHNLRPADASVNEDRSNKDFDNVQPGGFQHSEAISCFFTDSTWEPGPLTKGQVARIIFYMATRYEGTNGEMDLEVVPHNNTFPEPEHGNLVTLLKWNNEYPPSEMERTRNERLFGIQQNRNPFIDNPEFANYIWNNKSLSNLIVGNFRMHPNKPSPGEEVQISVELKDNSATPQSVKLFWGKTYESEDFQTEMTPDQSVYSTTISLSGFQPGERIYFNLEISDNQETEYIKANYLLPIAKEDLTFTAIDEVQGTANQTPLLDQQVTISGRVTANFDGSFYIQNNTDPRNGICIYGSLHTGNVGDSLVLSGEATEYANLTELKNISYLYNFEENKTTEPLEISISDINEDYESMLVKIKSIEFEDQGTLIQNENTTYAFSNGSGNSVVFSKKDSRLIGNRLPSGTIDLVGIVGQYQDIYQIIPRNMDDFILNTNAPFQYSYPKKVVTYPNPAITVLNINITQKITGLRIYNVYGKLIKEKQGDNKSVSVQNLPIGIYLLQVSLSNGEVYHSKFMKSY